MTYKPSSYWGSPMTSWKPPIWMKKLRSTEEIGSKHMKQSQETSPGDAVQLQPPEPHWESSKSSTRSKDPTVDPFEKKKKKQEISAELLQRSGCVQKMGWMMKDVWFNHFLIWMCLIKIWGLNNGISQNRPCKWEDVRRCDYRSKPLAFKEWDPYFQTNPCLQLFGGFNDISPAGYFLADTIPPGNRPFWWGIFMGRHEPKSIKTYILWSPCFRKCLKIKLPGRRCKGHWCIQMRWCPFLMWQGTYSDHPWSCEMLGSRLWPMGHW